MERKRINRIKMVPTEKKRTNKRLANQLGVASSIVSGWCTNVCQPSLGTHLQISECLGVKAQKLLREESDN